MDNPRSVLLPRPRPDERGSGPQPETIAVCGRIPRADGSELVVELCRGAVGKFVAMKKWVGELDGTRRPLRGTTIRVDEIDEVVAALGKAKNAAGGRG